MVPVRKYNRRMSLTARLVTSLILLSAAACQRAPESPPPSPLASVVEAPTSLALEPPSIGICPTQWTCDSITFFRTRSACQTACGAEPCFLDTNCNGRCICP